MSRKVSNKTESLAADNPGFSATTERGVSYSEAPGVNDTQSAFLIRMEETSKGPLPPPQILREYDKIIENGAERIMAMAEKEQAARLKERELNGESNRKLADRKLDYFKRGQWMGFSLALIVLLSAGLFAYLQFITLATILLATTLVALVGLFVYTTKNQNKE